MSTPSLVNTSLPVSLTPHMDPEVMNSTELLSTCQWIPPQHYLFQMANGVLLGAVACPGGKHGVLFMHSCFVLGIQLSIMLYSNRSSSSSSSFLLSDSIINNINHKQANIDYYSIIVIIGSISSMNIPVLLRW